MGSGIATSIETTIAPLSVSPLEKSGKPFLKFFSLQEVYFPSISVCNNNRVQASFLKKLGIFHDPVRMKAFYAQYISGEEASETDNELLNFTSGLADLLQHDYFYDYENEGNQYSILKYAGQQCNDMFLYVRYQNQTLFWRDMNDYSEYGPFYFGTDYGACCFFNGDANLKNWQENATDEVNPLFLKW